MSFSFEAPRDAPPTPRMGMGMGMLPQQQRAQPPSFSQQQPPLYPQQQPPLYPQQQPPHPQQQAAHKQDWQIQMDPQQEHNPFSPMLIPQLPDMQNIPPELRPFRDQCAAGNDQGVTYNNPENWRSGVGKTSLRFPLGSLGSPHHCAISSSI